MHETGWRCVTVPRAEDGVGGALRNAYADMEDLPDDMVAMLRVLNNHGGDRSRG